jgi:two-component system sensor histidine kinase YesM
MIRVTGKQEDGDIVFKVEDNGIGMNEEELKKLRLLISGELVQDDQSGFGMANVEKRLRMLYGPSYGMTVESTYGEGTVVTVRIPQV